VSLVGTRRENVVGLNEFRHEDLDLCVSAWKEERQKERREGGGGERGERGGGCFGFVHGLELFEIGSGEMDDTDELFSKMDGCITGDDRS